MKKPIILKMTKPQYLALLDVTDNISAMIGCGSDFDTINKKNVLLIDRMLNNNGYKRNFK